MLTLEAGTTMWRGKRRACNMDREGDREDFVGAVARYNLEEEGVAAQPPLLYPHPLTCGLLHHNFKLQNIPNKSF